MRRGEFALAWSINDAILAGRDMASADDPTQPYHQRWIWDGTKPDGCRVLVRCYHGLGDTLQFARFLPTLRARAAHVTLEVQPELLALLSNPECADLVFGFDPASPLPAHECTMEIMELGHVLRANELHIASNPYLSVPSCKDPVVSAAAGAVALCWQAGDWDRERSIGLDGLLRSLAPLRQRFVSLQRGEAGQEADSADFVNPRDDNRDIARTAALIGAAAVTVTVDSMVAHLTGALGCPCVLLAKFDPDWRWPLAASTVAGRTIWYPSVRILHQRGPGDWSGSLNALAAECRSFIPGTEREARVGGPRG